MSGIKGKRYINEKGEEVLTGGLRAAKTNKERHGEGFYARIGAIGGRRGHTGGFASNPELARIAGAKGGRASKRGSALDRSKWEEHKDTIIEEYTNEDISIMSLAKKYNIEYEVVRKGLRNEML